MWQLLGGDWQNDVDYKVVNKMRQSIGRNTCKEKDF